jgi:hypothetical protein
MFMRKQIVNRFFVLLSVLWLIPVFGLQALAKEQGPNGQISLSEATSGSSLCLGTRDSGTAITPQMSEGLHKVNADSNLPAVGR